jgi:hypothetical protein
MEPDFLSAALLAKRLIRFTAPSAPSMPKELCGAKGNKSVCVVDMRENKWVL